MIIKIALTIFVVIASLIFFMIAINLINTKIKNKVLKGLAYITTLGVTFIFGRLITIVWLLK